MVDIKEIEKTCLRRIETTMNYEKDPDIQRQIEETGEFSVNACQKIRQILV